MTLFSSISDPFGGTVTGIVKHSPIQQEYHVTGYSVEPFKQDPSICTISGHFSEYRTAYAERECPFLGNWFISNTEEYWRVVSVSFLPSEARLPWGCCLITNLNLLAPEPLLPGPEKPCLRPTARCLAPGLPYFTESHIFLSDSEAHCCLFR